MDAGVMALSKKQTPSHNRSRHSRSLADYKNVFESIPGLYLLLTPELRIVTASTEYLLATHHNRKEITGHFMFDVFPDNPSLTRADGVNNLSRSFEEVLRSGSPQQMRLQRYDVRDEISGTGEWVEKYWSPSNYPIFPPGSREVLYIVHRVQDATPLVQFGSLPEVEKVFREAFEMSAAGAEDRSIAIMADLDSAENQFVTALDRVDRMREETFKRTDAALGQLESRLSLGLKRLDWQKPYYDAIYQSDPFLRSGRILSAEWAIDRRMREMSLGGEEAPSERIALMKAMTILQELKKPTRSD